MDESYSSQVKLKDNDEVEMVYIQSDVTSQHGFHGDDVCDVDDNPMDFAHSEWVEEHNSSGSTDSLNFLDDVQKAVEQSCCVRVLKSKMINMFS